NSGLYVQTTPDGEMTWGEGTSADKADKVFGANLTLAEVRSHGNAGQGWVDTLGVDPHDADYVVRVMTEQDWAAYKVAVERGPDAMRKWFDAILARRTD